MKKKSEHFNLIIVMALSLDGISAIDSNHHVDWSSREDKRFFVNITKEAGVVIMGSKTFDMIGKVLPERKNVVLTRNKKRISENPDLIFTDNPPQKIIEDLKKEGYTSAALIGGSQANTLFARENLVSELYVTYEPVLFGRGLSLFNRDFKPDFKPELVKVLQIGNDSVTLRYKLKYKTPKA